MEQLIEKKMNPKVLYEYLLLCCLFEWKIGLLHSQPELNGNHFLIVFDFFMFY